MSLLCCLSCLIPEPLVHSRFGNSASLLVRIVFLNLLNMLTVTKIIIKSYKYLFRGSIDGNQCLIVKGRFQQKHFESVLRKYISKFFEMGERANYLFGYCCTINYSCIYEQEGHNQNFGLWNIFYN